MPWFSADKRPELLAAVCLFWLATGAVLMSQFVALDAEKTAWQQTSFPCGAANTTGICMDDFDSRNRQLVNCVGGVGCCSKADWPHAANVYCNGLPDSPYDPVVTVYMVFGIIMVSTWPLCCVGAIIGHKKRKRPRATTQTPAIPLDSAVIEVDGSPAPAPAPC